MHPHSQPFLGWGLRFVPGGLEGGEGRAARRLDGGREEDGAGRCAGQNLSLEGSHSPDVETEAGRGKK
jgi:hypothetical protein